MIAYLPEIYPDELVYSWFCRYAVHSGYITNKQALRDLYCKKSDTPLKEFIGNLNPEARACIDKMYPMEGLVLNHTMYPQYARFIPLEQKKNALYKLCYENCDVHHLFSVLPRCEKEQYLKYCPVCAREDRSKYGETYWHRKHQIRNMRICPKHKCLLCDSNISAKSIGTYTFSAAQMVIPEEEECVTVDNPLQIKFAGYLDQIFDAPVDLVNDIPISTILYHVMKDTEYMTLKGIRRDMRKFVDDLTYYYEQIGLNQIASENQIQRMMLSGDNYDFSSACQIGFFLNMTVEEAVTFFENIPSIRRKMETLNDVGLSYIRLGQPSTELSGGEAQRIKLATELSKRSTGKTVYILDEPTTGLHFADVHKLTEILQRLTAEGNTVIVIEHNLDVIKTADYIIDIGPEGGDKGGTVVAYGTPEEIAQNEKSYTGKYIDAILKKK